MLNLELIKLRQYCSFFYVSLSSSRALIISLKQPIDLKAIEFISCNLFYVGGILVSRTCSDFMLKRSLYISDTSTNIFCQVAGYAFQLSSFNKGSSKSLLFSNMLNTLSLDFQIKLKILYSFDCSCKISICSVTKPSKTYVYNAFLNWVFDFLNKLLHASISVAKVSSGNF